MAAWVISCVTFPSSQEGQPSTSIAELQGFLGSIVTNSAGDTKGTVVSSVTKLDRTTRGFSRCTALSFLTLKQLKPKETNSGLIWPCKLLNRTKANSCLLHRLPFFWRSYNNCTPIYKRKNLFTKDFLGKTGNVKTNQNFNSGHIKILKHDC